MKDMIDAIQKFRLLMDVSPTGKEITFSEFEDILNSWFQKRKINYGNADIWSVNWLGKSKWIAMHHLDTKKYYKI